MLKKRAFRRKQETQRPLSRTHHRLAERFQRRCEAYKNGVSFDPGLSAPGTLRFLLPTESSYKACVLTAYDRTLAEWNALITEWKACSWFGVNQGLVLESLFQQSQRMRWIARKWIRKVRMRILARRTVGLVDLHTVAEIPLEARVTIYDYPTRSCYAFHANTLERILTTSLSYHAYGIASPQEPKNPYTNVPFTLAQNLSLLQQLIRTLTLWNRVVPHKLMRWHAAHCSIRRLVHTHFRALQVDAAVSFLKRPTEGEALAVFRECVEDLYNLIEVDLRGRSAVLAYVKARRLSPELMAQWDTLILAYWILHNHNLAYGDYTSIDDLEHSFVLLHNTTHQWWVSHRRVILPRVVAVAASLHPGPLA